MPSKLAGLAGKAPKSSGTKKTPKVAATASDKCKRAVDTHIKNKAKIKQLTAEMKDADSNIINEVMPQYVEKGRSGDFTKTLEVQGNDGSVIVVTADSFSVPQDEDIQTELKELIGDDMYAEFFEKSTGYRISPEAPDEVIDALVDAAQEKGIDVSSLFVSETKLTAKPDLDRKILNKLTPEQYETFISLCRQKAPSIK